MPGEVHVINHPLVQHKLTLLRQKDISTSSFRNLVAEISMLLAYEVTRDLPLIETEVETPMAEGARRPAGRQEDRAHPDPARGHRHRRRHAAHPALGARRPHRHLPRSRDAGRGRVLPQAAGRDAATATCIVADPLLATGNSASRRRRSRQGRPAQVDPLRLPGGRARRAWPTSTRATPTCPSTPPPSTSASTNTATSCPAWATPATACSGRNELGSGMLDQPAGVVGVRQHGLGEGAVQDVAIQNQRSRGRGRSRLSLTSGPQSRWWSPAGPRNRTGS